MLKLKFNFLDKEFNRKIKLILLLLVAGMILETISLGMFLPVMNILFANPAENIFINFIKNLKIINLRFEILILIIFIFIFLLKNLFLIFSSYYQTSVIEKIKMSLKFNLFKNYLKKDYGFFLKNNTSFLLRNLTTECDYAVIVLFNLINFFSEFLVTLGILAILLYFDSTLTLTIFFSILLFISLIFLSLRKKLKKYGNVRIKNDGLKIKYFSQGLFAAKEIKLLHVENSLISSASQTLLELLKVNIFTIFAKAIVKYYVEVFLVVLFSIAIITLILLDYEYNIIAYKLGFFGIVAFRLTPAISRMFIAFQEIKYRKKSVKTIADEFERLNKTISEKVSSNIFSDSLTFSEKLELKNINFNYEDKQDKILNGLDLFIERGSTIGITGKSGVGKSTLVNLITGLIKPTNENAKILSDGKSIHKNLKSWQKKIGYVPQLNYFIDDTILNNIAFGQNQDEINLKKVKEIIVKCELFEAVESLPDKLETKIGEKGIKLSGGQQQRLGLARALYNDPELLILDESTSALDIETENKIIKTVKKLRKDKTIIIISHRSNTIKEADKVYEFQSGKLINIR